MQLFYKIILFLFQNNKNEYYLMEKYKYPIVLSIAGSDCSGGAGIQADLKTISALGAYATTAITAVTVQNTVGVSDIHPIPVQYIQGQIEAVMDDLQPDALKIGMVNEVNVIDTIANTLSKYTNKWIVYDPVMVSTSGYRLIEEKAIERIKEKLFPLASVITPNLQEAEVLIHRKIESLEDMRQAAIELLQYGSGAVLLKGGHLKGDNMTDLLIVAPNQEVFTFTAPKIRTENTHGTGCSLSSAIATQLAKGDSLPQAIENAKKYVYQGIVSGADVKIGNGHGPLNHFFEPIPLIKQLK